MDPGEQISMKFFYQNETIFIEENDLENGGHFVSASMC